MTENNLSMDELLDDVEAETKELATSNPELAARVLAQNSKNALHIYIDTFEVNELPCFAVFSGTF